MKVWIFAVVLVYLGHQCDCLQNVRLLIPFSIQRGHPAFFQCLYDMEGDALYSVKWYKGSREFYRYAPTENPSIKIFPLPGINVDAKHSNASHLYLKKVNTNVSGWYECEVSADAPSFQTTVVRGETHVVEIPTHTPTIAGIKPKYRLGDVLKGNCTCSGSSPATNLTWYINGEPADSKYAKPFKKYRSEHNLETSHLGIRFTINRHHFGVGRLKIRCVASLYDIYWKSSEISVDEERPKLNMFNAVTPNTLGVNQLPSPDETYQSSKSFFDNDLPETRHHHSYNMVQYAEHHPSATDESISNTSSVPYYCYFFNNIIYVVLFCTSFNVLAHKFTGNP